MIAAIGNSEYLNRRTAPLLQELNHTRDPILVGTDYPNSERSTARSGRIAVTDRDVVLAHQNVDTVYISSATGRHFDDCRAALAAGKHVLVEKPVCLGADKAAELDSMARARGRTVFECLSYSYHPIWSDFTAKVRAANWTDHVSVSAVFRIPEREATDFRRDPRHGGAAADLGTYCIDALMKLGAVAQDLEIGTVLVADSDSDGGAAITRRLLNCRNFTFAGSWSFGDSYRNSIVVADSQRRLELYRAFSPPVDASRPVVERTMPDPSPRTVAARDPTNATRASLGAAMSHLRDAKSSGLVDCQAILDRIAALDKITSAIPET